MSEKNNDTLPIAKIFNHELRECWDSLQGGKTIAIYKCLVEITGSIKTAIFLSQLLYWTRVGVIDRDGWVFKSIEETIQETGLTKREQGLCKEKLIELNLIVIRRVGFGAHLALKINLDEMAKKICHAYGISVTPSITIHDLKNRSALFFRRFFSQRIAYHRDLVSLTGCIYAAIMLSHMMRLLVNSTTINSIEKCASICFTIEEWQKYLLIPYKTQLSARNRLKEIGFIMEKHFEASRRISTSIRGKNITAAIKKNIEYHQSQKNHLNSGGNHKKYSGDKWEIQEVTINKIQLAQKGYSRSDHSESSVKTKGNLKKCRSNKKGNTEVTNGEILIINNNYNNNNYNNSLTNVSQTSPRPLADDVVVDHLDFSTLIFPTSMNKEMQNLAIKIIQQKHPTLSIQHAQEILDEIEGQTKPVKSPLGLLNTLLSLEASGRLVCNVASIVRKKREERQRAVQEITRREEISKQNVTAMNSVDALDNIRAILRIKPRSDE